MDTNRLPVGTVIWRMAGYEHEGKIYWSARPNVIEVSNPRGFWLDVFPKSDAVQGNTWNNIGRNYFLSREECLASWGDKPLIQKADKIKTGEPTKSDAPIGEYVVEPDDPNSVVYINIGSDLLPFDKNRLKWNQDTEFNGFISDNESYRVLTLDGKLFAYRGHRVHRMTKINRREFFEHCDCIVELREQ